MLKIRISGRWGICPKVYFKLDSLSTILHSRKETCLLNMSISSSYGRLLENRWQSCCRSSISQEWSNFCKVGPCNSLKLLHLVQLKMKVHPPTRKLACYAWCVGQRRFACPIEQYLANAFIATSVYSPRFRNHKIVGIIIPVVKVRAADKSIV